MDIFYGSDKSKWITLANTLKFRLALNEGNSGKIAAALSAGVIDEKSRTGYSSTEVTNRILTLDTHGMVERMSPSQDHINLTTSCGS